MSNDYLSESVRSHERGTQRLVTSAGTAYGLVFGLSFALFTWGYDGLILARAAANLAWAKLLLGLPLAIAIGALAGRLTAQSSSTAASVALWATAGALLGIVAGRLPFDGGNIAAWLADRRLWGLITFPQGSSAATRTSFVAVIGAAIGVAAGLLQRLAVEWAWDRASPRGRMSRRSWAVMLVCIPLVFLLAWAVDEQVNEPLRTPQQRLGELIALTLAGKDEEAEARGLNYATVQRYREAFSERYTVHLVKYDLETHHFFQLDVAFDNDFALRCFVVGGQVGFCDDISPVFAAWMDDLIHAGLTGERRWLASAGHALTVDETAVAWLRAHSDQLSETYEVTKTSQQGGWVFMSAYFETGLEIVCRFRGAMPVLVDQCVQADSRR